MTENQNENAEILENNSDKFSNNSKNQIDEKNIEKEEVIDDELKSESSVENQNISSTTESRLEQLEKEHETLKSQYVRIAADFDNFRKRQSRDQDDLKIQLICKSLSSILPIVDNFERARQQLKPEGEEAQTLHRNYQGLYKQLVDVLKQQGVAPMRVVGQQFDPSLHEAVLREPNEEYDEDIIVEELQRGYHLDGKVLRHALVKVSMGPGPSKTPQVEVEKDTVNEEAISDDKSPDEK